MNWLKWRIILPLLLYLISIPVNVNAQITFPYDNGGYYQISIQDNTIVISGTLINVDSIPSGWEPFISMNSPCADLVTRDEWDCHNPSQPGYRSLAFTKIIDVVFEDGCEGKLAAWIKGHPELGILWFDSNKNYRVVKVEIRNACDTAIVKRNVANSNFISPEEAVRLYAKIRSNDIKFEFPTTLEGFINATNIEKKKVILGLSHTEPGWAEYELGPFPAVSLVDSIIGLEVIAADFSINFRNSPHCNIYITRVPFRFEEFIFEGNIPLEGEANNVVCYLENTSVLTFGARIKVLNEDWLTECSILDAELTGGEGTRLDIPCIILNARVQEATFDMPPQVSCYPVNWYGGGSQEFGFVFNMQINGGQHFPLNNGASINAIVYNGFEANILPPIHELRVRDSVNIFARPEPRLNTGEKRIKYQWSMQPSNLAHLVPLDYPGGYGQRLVADAPGIINLSYTIRDTVSGSTDVSPVRQVVIGPASIQITSPAAGQKFVFNGQNPGVLEFRCSGTTGDSVLDRNIVGY
jgi:hypothetical protein